MNNTFQGFTKEQTQKIAKKLGYNGPLEGLGKFLQSSPNAALQFARMSKKANEIASTSAARGYAEGGQVVPYAKSSEKIQNLAENQYLNTDAPAQTEKITEQENQFIDENVGKISDTESQTTAPVIDKTPDKQASSYQSSTVSDKVAAIGSPDAVTGGPSEQATVQGQLKNLIGSESDFNIKTPPSWASEAIRGTQEMLAARGLGASSIAGQAIMTAVAEAATPIAMADAQTYSTFEREELARKQQVEFQKYQADIQALFSDQAAENASKQFNAQSENQLKTFYSELAQSYNLAQASMEQSTEQFNANMLNARQQFNAKNSLAIAQANAEWRQRISEVNTAAQNATNQLNASIVANRSNLGFEALVQLERDEMDFLNDAFNRAFTADQNELNRQSDIVIATMSRDLQSELAEDNQWFEAAAAAGSAAVNILTSDVGSDIIDFVGGLF
jgi:hypothetical protein